MKTSNIIIISLIGSLLLLILTAAIEVRLLGEHRSKVNYPMSEEKSTEFQSINHIVIHDISVTIEQKDENKVTVFYPMPGTYINEEIFSDEASHEKINNKANNIPGPKLKISGDTLFIDKDIMPGQENNNHVSISISDYLHSVTGNNSNITIKGGLTKSIDVEGNNLFISGRKIEGQFSNIDLTANNARVNIITPLDTLSLQLENSTADIRNPVNLLQGEIRKNSTLNTQEARYHMNVVKDLNSKLRVH